MNAQATASALAADREALLQALAGLAQAGQLRLLDLALARFLAEQDLEATASLLLAASLTSWLEAQGHVCLDLAALHSQGAGLLGWPEDALAAVRPWWSQLPVSGAHARRSWAVSSDRFGAVLGGVASGDEAADPQTPLVLEGDRLYLRRYRALECAVAAQLTRRAAQEAGTADRGDVQAWLDRLFGPPADAPPAEPDWQRVACERAVEGSFTLITGGPGTGKTYTAARLLVLLQALHRGPQPLRIGLAAPTGKAAARLRQSIEQGLQSLADRPGALSASITASPLPAARTLHALLGVRPRTRRFAHDAERPLPLDVLLVDEASMVHLELMQALLQALPPHARLILLGDSEQLASVEAGSVLGDLCAAPPDSPLAAQTVRLRHSRRFAGPIGAAAQAVNAGDAAALLGLLTSPSQAVQGAAPGAAQDPLRQLRLPRSTPSAPGAGSAELARCALVGEPVRGTGLPAAAASIDLPPGHAAWLQRLRERPRERGDFERWALSLIRQFEAFRVLCALRDGPRGVSGLNELIEREAVARGWLQRRGAWYEGRPVMVTRNDPGLRLFNGDIGLVLRSPPSAAGEGGLRAWFGEGDAVRSVAVNRLPEVETAFAMTVHKSQGSEFDHVLMVLPDEDLPLLTRELLYTGITRARRWLTLAFSDDAVLAQAAARRTWRMSGLRDRLSGTGAGEALHQPD